MDVKALAAASLPALGFLGYVTYNSLWTCDAGHKGIIFNKFKGVKADFIYSEGTHFKIPWFDIPIVYDVRTHPRTISSLTGTKDLQMINISLRVLYRPEQYELPSIYRNLGRDYDERILPSIVNEVLKSVVA